MQTSLSGALSSLQTSTALLSSSLSILDAGISDLPRLSRVLAQTRHFELVPASALAAQQAAVVSELAPELEALLTRVEAHVERLERREQSLRAKWRLQEGRLGRMSGGADEEKRSGIRSGGGGGARQDGVDAVQGIDGLKAKQLRQKKERLSYAVERLQTQAQQKERQLRMSMAAQEEKVSRRDAFGDEDELA